MKLHCISTTDELLGLAAEWEPLAQGVPFRRPGWLATWWKHYGRESRSTELGRLELCTLAVRDDDGRLIGLAPWYIERSVARGSVIRFLGSGNVCTDYLSILSRRWDESRVAATVAAWLVGDGRQLWDRIDLQGVDAEDVAVRELVRQMGERGCTVYERDTQSCWRLALPVTWEEYLALLSKSHRKQIRRLQRRASDDVRVLTAREPDELRHGLASLIDFQRRRREQLGETTSFDDDRFCAFLSEVSEHFFAEGRLRLQSLQLQDRTAAVDLNFEGNGILYGYQGAIEPDLLAEEPGRLLLIGWLQQAIEEGLDAVDFLRGDEPYKQHFRAEPRRAVEVRVVSPSVASQMRHNAWLAGESMKSWLKSGFKAFRAGRDQNQPAKPRTTKPLAAHPSQDGDH